MLEPFRDGKFAKVTKRGIADVVQKASNLDRYYKGVFAFNAPSELLTQVSLRIRFATLLARYRPTWATSKE